MKIANLPEDLAFNCSYCGTCLYFCPVYQKTGIETFGPRGRVNLIQGLMNGELQQTDYMKYIFSKCALCQRCVENCPSGLDITNLILDIRADYNKGLFCPSSKYTKKTIKSFSRALLYNFLSHAFSIFVYLVLRYRYIYEANLKIAYIVQKLFPHQKQMISWLPYPLQGWTHTRLMRPVARESFRKQWLKNKK